jgi:hypothetical protein
MTDIDAPVWPAPTMEAKLQHAKDVLGEKWVLHPANAPAKGHYDGRGRPLQPLDTLHALKA